MSATLENPPSRKNSAHLQVTQTGDVQLLISGHKNTLFCKATSSGSRLTLAVLWDVLEAFSECSLIAVMAGTMHTLLYSFSASFVNTSQKLGDATRPSSTTVRIVHRNTSLGGRGKHPAAAVLLCAAPRALTIEQERTLAPFSMPSPTSGLFSAIVISSALTTACEHQHLAREMSPIYRSSGVTTCKNIFLTYCSLL